MITIKSTIEQMMLFDTRQQLVSDISYKPLYFERDSLIQVQLNLTLKRNLVIEFTVTEL